MSSDTYLVNIMKFSENEGVVDVFSESCNFDSIQITMQRAYQAVFEDSGSRRYGKEIVERDIIDGAVVTRVLDTQTTTSGRTFSLLELNGGEKILAVAHDVTYEVTRLPRVRAEEDNA